MDDTNISILIDGNGSQYIEFSKEAQEFFLRMSTEKTENESDEMLEVVSKTQILVKNDDGTYDAILFNEEGKSFNELNNEVQEYFLGLPSGEIKNESSDSENDSNTIRSYKTRDGKVAICCFHFK